jgi:hypothetical protein
MLPTTSNAAPDAFERLADALREVMRGDAETIDSDRTRNLLLDACGSDHRMLVELVLSVRTDVRDAVSRVVDATTLNASAWETQRAPMVHRLVATRYLQSDIARWLVDVWAYALDVRGVRPHAPSVQHAHDATAHDARAHDAPASRSAPGAHTLPRHAATIAPTPRATGSRTNAGLPGWATGPARTSRIPRATTTRMTPAELARIQRIERVSLIVLALSVIVGFAAEGWALYSRPIERQSMPNAAAPAEREPASTNATASTAIAGTTVANPEVSTPLVSTDSMARAAYGSVAGRYRVEHSQVSVGGSDGCDEVARALALQRPSMEVVEHTMGSTTIRWPSRGLAGVIEPDGRFTTGPDSGVTDGVRWTFTMAGRFSRDGFVAQTQKTTDAVLAWHKSRTCSVVATVNGTRVGG